MSSTARMPGPANADATCRRRRGKSEARSRDKWSAAMLKANTAVVTDSYLDLIREFPLRSIRSERELDAAQAVLDRLLRSPRDAGSEQYLGALTDLIEVYEDKTHPIPDASEADVLRTLMSSNDLTQSSLARQVGISQSTISAVL